MGYDRRTLKGTHPADGEARCPRCLKPLEDSASETADDGARVHRECPS